MERLPLEVVLHILSFVPLSTFPQLYYCFPESVMDEALRQKLLRLAGLHIPLFDLVSTNLHELQAPFVAYHSRRNESFMPLHVASVDKDYRFIWCAPAFAYGVHYFKVKDAYVSHGRLVLRLRRTETGIEETSASAGSMSDTSVKQGGGGKEERGDHIICSLWDICKRLPPTRAGTFSGASEFATQPTAWQDVTVKRVGCLVDGYLLASPSGRPPQTLPVACQREKSTPPRPPPPVSYRPCLPDNESASPFISHAYPESAYPDPTCGYFVVEQVAVSIPTFLSITQTLHF